MKKIKYIGIIFVFSYLLNGCDFISKTHADISQNIKLKETNIENLPNDNYSYCSDPNPYPYEDKIDAHRYCFIFTKTGNKIVGFYSYRAPKDTPQICIEGTPKSNLITGVGYEEISPGSQPYTEEEFSNLEELPLSKQLSYWDDLKGFQGGLNLKVGNPSWYKLSSAMNEPGSYWVTRRYGIAKLDLSDFEYIEIDDLSQFAKCTNR